MPPDLKSNDQLNKPTINKPTINKPTNSTSPPLKHLDISNWQPMAPQWEKTGASVEHMKSMCVKFKDHTENWGKNIYEHQFAMNNLKKFVYDSNTFEDAGEDENKTNTLIDGVLLHQNGNTSDFNVPQLEVVNHIKAIQIALQLSIEELVSIDGFKSVHKVLMDGVLESTGVLRKCQAHTSVYHQYPDPDDVPVLLQLVIKNYHTIEKSNVDVFTKAAWLTCQFLVIHPFEDGNGRLSRILLAAMFIKSGLYIFPSLSKNGHKKSRKHYINSLLKAAKGQSESGLAFFFLKCCYNIVCNYENSCIVL